MLSRIVAFSFVGLVALSWGTFTRASSNVVTLSKVTESVPFKGTDAEFDDVMLEHGKDILDLYQPAHPGYIRILSKSVSGGREPVLNVQMKAKILFVVKSATLRGQLRVNRESCAHADLGYSAIMDLSQSDDLIRSNISEVRIGICGTRSGDNIVLTAVPRLIMGPSPGLGSGEIKGLMQEQVQPILNAFVEELNRR